jgi:hypothetical protein
VTDHEAALLNPNLFSSLKFGSQASGVVETKVWTADKQPAALLAKIDRVVRSTRNSAARGNNGRTAILALSTRKTAIGRQELGVGIPLFSMALVGPYGGELCSGGLRDQFSIFNYTLYIIRFACCVLRAACYVLHGPSCAPT